MGEKMNLNLGNRLFVVGHTGSGKTFFIKKLLEKLQRYVVYDIEHSYKDGEIVSNIKDLTAKVKENKKNYKIVYRPKTFDLEEFEEVCKFVFTYLRFTWFVVDEVHKLASTYKITAWFNSIITRGRKRGIGCISASQRCANVHNDILSQADHVVVFFLYRKIDIDYLARDIKGVEKAKELNGNKQFHFLHFNAKQLNLSEYSPI